MTTWTPVIPKGEDRIYLAIAKAIRRDIRSGRLEPGARLPTHRVLADALGVAVGTVTRAYTEAERQGLVRGEIGRGTFVRSGGLTSAHPMQISEGPTGFVDLSLNHPLYSEDPELGPTLRAIARRDDASELLRYQASEGLMRHREAGARWAEKLGVNATAESMVVCAGAQHALTVTLASVAKPGEFILAEELAYPGIRGVAELLHLKLAGVGMDGEGLLPDALAAACRQRKVRALYCTPTIQNPTSTVLSESRRREIADIAREHDVWIVEDDVHRGLVPDAPPSLASLAPNQTFFVAGTSKAVAGGTRIAFLRVPAALVGRIAQAVWSTVWMVPPLCAEVVATWIEDGTAQAALERKRAELAGRQRLAAEILRDSHYRAHPNGLYVWLELPPPWRSSEFAAAARRRGVGVTPAELFLVEEREAPAAVRVCLGAAPDRRTLKLALKTLAEVLVSTPGLGPAIV